MKQQRVKIDWDTVELVGDLVPASVSKPKPTQLTSRPVMFPVTRSDSFASDPSIAKPDPRSKLILSGASAKARSRGSSQTHVQLRKVLPVGLETLIYGWWLVTAAIESDRDLSRAVEIAANAIAATSQRFNRQR